MILEIEVPDGDEFDMLSGIASDNKMTPEQYATSIVLSFITPRVRDSYIAQVQAMATDDIKTLVLDAVAKKVKF